MKKKYYIVVFFVSLLILEYQLLNKMLSKQHLEVVFISDYKEETVPTYTLGYKKYTEKILFDITKSKDLDCRSLRFNLSFNKNKIYQEIDAYCEYDNNFTEEKKIDLVNSFENELKKNSNHMKANVKLIDFNEGNNSYKNKSNIFILSLLFVLLVFISIPWRFLFYRG